MMFSLRTFFYERVALKADYWPTPKRWFNDRWSQSPVALCLVEHLGGLERADLAEHGRVRCATLGMQSRIDKIRARAATAAYLLRTTVGESGRITSSRAVCAQLPITLRSDTGVSLESAHR
eukprot:gnl/Spiro4/3285_TR1602_c0_g1_i1.p1 gnl/Spiro4/3285_TR1602_c0_g1~~gnl/Spiro4/3285_TR1602_c0_g1_i1.p1  ORF type:complete len:121 (+),score=5.73 gnl/Spiro4/3285_TR1602_c0_g1_i1:86-448(+)